MAVTKADRPPPKQARAKARIALILSTAETLLLDAGAGAVTTTAIAETAGIPVGSVYRYFDDKNDILWRLHSEALQHIQDAVTGALSVMEPGRGFKETLMPLLRIFWQTARTHPSFSALTRWANGQFSLRDTTPGVESNLGVIVIAGIKVAGVELPEARRDAILRTTVTTLSVLVDQAIEEDDEAIGEALIDELGHLLAAYIG